MAVRDGRGRGEESLPPCSARSVARVVRNTRSRIGVCAPQPLVHERPRLVGGSALAAHLADARCCAKRADRSRPGEPELRLSCGARAPRLHGAGRRSKSAAIRWRERPVALAERLCAARVVADERLGELSPHAAASGREGRAGPMPRGRASASASPRRGRAPSTTGRRASPAGSRSSVFGCAVGLACPSSGVVRLVDEHDVPRPGGEDLPRRSRRRARCELASTIGKALHGFRRAGTGDLVASDVVEVPPSSAARRGELLGELLLPLPDHARRGTSSDAARAVSRTEQLAQDQSRPRSSCRGRPRLRAGSSAGRCRPPAGRSRAGGATRRRRRSRTRHRCRPRGAGATATKREAKSSGGRSAS